MANFSDGEEYEFDEIHLVDVLEAFSYTNALTASTPLPQLVEEFKQFQKPVDGVYHISVDIYLSFVNFILNNSIGLSYGNFYVTSKAVYKRLIILIQRS